MLRCRPCKHRYRPGGQEQELAAERFAGGRVDGEHALRVARGAAMDDFARVIAGMTSSAEFFSEENVGLIPAAAA